MRFLYILHKILVEGLKGMGIDMLVNKEYRLPSLNTVIIPSGVDDASTREKLFSKYHIEIGAGLGNLSGKIWRIGLMGYSAKASNVDKLLSALNRLI